MSGTLSSASTAATAILKASHSAAPTRWRPCGGRAPGAARECATVPVGGDQPAR